MQKLLFIFIIALAAFSCKKESSSPSAETPDCIHRKIEAFKKADPQQISVYRYEYNGQTVYYIPGAGCMRLGELYDSSCNLICHPDGGFTGAGDGKCNDFFDKRKNEELIWKDPRQ